MGLVVLVFLLGALATDGCVSLWPTTNTHVAATPADARSCAVAQAKELGYRVGPDTTHGSVTAEKTLPFRENGPDPTVFSVRNALAVSMQADGTHGSKMSVTAQTISVQQSRRGMQDIPVSATSEVRADADTLVARCRHVGPGTSLPGG